MGLVTERGSQAARGELNKPQNGSRTLPDFLSGGGQVGEAMRSLDWSGSPVGDPDTWPQSLRSMVRLMLTTEVPVGLYWGTERAFLYNDALSALLDPERHPGALGRPGAEVWPDIWPELGPQIDAAMRGSGDLTRTESRRWLVRDGVHQETWWNTSLSPIDDPSSADGVGGVL